MNFSRAVSIVAPPATTAIVAVAVIGIWAVTQGAAAEPPTTRYDADSRYYRIRVLDYPDAGRRCLLFSKSRGIQSSMILADPAALDFQYTRSMTAALAFPLLPGDAAADAEKSSASQPADSSSDTGASGTAPFAASKSFVAPPAPVTSTASVPVAPAPSAPVAPSPAGAIPAASATVAAPAKSPPREVLLIGLGGASLPKFMQKNYPSVHLDIVEIDPDVVKVCQDWFQFKTSGSVRVIVMDGRMYLKRSTKRYDIIMLDAYSSDLIPFHLTTLEFAELVKSRLKPGGLVATNLWEQSMNRFFMAELRTYQTTFPQTYVFKSGTSGNVILFASLAGRQATKAAWGDRAAALSAGLNLGFDMAGLIAAEYEYLTPVKIAEKPLTDDMAPVNTLRRENAK